MFAAIGRFWKWFRTPSARWAKGTILVAGGIGGLVFAGVFTTTLHMTATNEFCGSSCHSLREFVLPEYKQSVHYSNRLGVRAECQDCHLAKAFIPKMQRKIRAAWTDVPGEIFGWIDTREKFDARRKELAEVVWAEMRANDSRECRSCHDREAMKSEEQKAMARKGHEEAEKTGETCIDCHKGVAHTAPEKPAKEGESDDFSL